jgi:5'(3')-deoxyribonucleotidase
MKKLTIGKLINEYGEVLSMEIIVELKRFQKKKKSFKKQVYNLNKILFSEETDFMHDSRIESKERNKGINPMNEKYIESVKKKRKSLGVTPLNENGLSSDGSSWEFCRELIRRTGNYSEKINRKKRHIKDTVFVDMDNVLVNFQSGIDKITKEEREEYAGRYDEVSGIFSKMEPNEGAIESYKWLTKYFEVYILSTSPWENPSAWSDKLLWVKKYLGEEAFKRLILSHHKNLLKGQFIIDDRTVRGVNKFDGKHIHFGEDGDYRNWKEVVSYLKDFIS